MTYSEWVLVLFGAVVAYAGSWIQLHPERMFPVREEWCPEAAALAQVRQLGGCFVFMGAFFAMQMALILAGQPWWMGSLSGVAVAVMAVILLSARNRRREIGNSLTTAALDNKALQAR
jgi:uncharacterized membrane protein HdeD (DUF308 family)